MKTIRIGFDVDGCLRCNCTETCQDPNWGVVTMFNLLSGMKNTDMYVWSGGGADYARRFAKLYDLKVKEANCLSKLTTAPNFIDLAFDDQHEFSMGKINLIVREK